MVDIKDIPRDSKLRFLRHALDTETMRERLVPHFAGEAEIVSVKLERFAYKPGRSARFIYQVRLRDKKNQKARHIMHARMETPENIASLHSKMLSKEWKKPRFGPAMLWLPDLDTILWGFPNDPKLEGLQNLSDPKLLHENLLRLPGMENLEPDRYDSTVVKFVPGKRLVMRHQIGQEGSPAEIYTKTFGDEEGRAIYEVMHHLWQKSREDDQALTTPEPLGYLDSLHTIVQRALPGGTAVTTLQEDNWRSFMRQAGRGLARIHDSGVQNLEPWGAGEEWKNYEKACRILQNYDEELKPTIERITRRLEEQLRRLSIDDPVPVHTAFRFTQLLAFEGRLALLDFDGFRCGDRLGDVGSFVAHLYYMAAKDEISSDRAREAAREFCHAYQVESACDLDSVKLAWFTAVTLIAKHAQKCVKRLKDDGDDKISRLLNWACELVSAGSWELPDKAA